MIYYGANNNPIYYGANEATIYYGSDLIYPTTITGITLGKSALSFGEMGGTKMVRLASESDWEILIDPAATWLSSVTPLTGTSGRSQITIVCGENTGGTELTTTITARTTDLQYSATCEITLKYEQPYNEIWYTTSDGQVLTTIEILHSTDNTALGVFGANIVSNTYTGGMGIITFDGNVTSVGNYTSLYTEQNAQAFRDVQRLTSISFPNSVMTIGSYVCTDCPSLTSATIPNQVQSIGHEAFAATIIQSVEIPSTITKLGYWAFNWNVSLNQISCLAANRPTDPYMGDSDYWQPFDGCAGPGTLTIPTGANYTKWITRLGNNWTVVRV